MTWRNDPVAVLAELEDIQADIPFRVSQLERARVELEAQRARTFAAYGNHYPASSHHAITTLEAKVADAAASLADGYEWMAELQALAGKVAA